MTVIFQISLAVLVAVLPTASYAETEFLTNQDVSRGELAEIDAAILEPVTKGVGIPFIFPADVNPDYVYGIDISHHSFGKGVAFDWSTLHKAGIAFVYSKATQGETFVDKTFETTWKALSQSAVSGGARRGAYHFLTARGNPDLQAEKFLEVVTGFELGRDMPPVVDLEWDCKIAKGRVVYDKSGRCIDLWDGVEPSEIASKVDRFADLVEDALKVRPIIYTAASWWNGVGLTTELAGERLWIADYTRKSQRTGKPRIPAGYSFVIWQYTDNSKVHDRCLPTHAVKRDLCNDANIFRGSMREFLDSLGLE